LEFKDGQTNGIQRWTIGIGDMRRVFTQRKEIGQQACENSQDMLTKMN
jgi:hypothetical protein